MTPQITIRLLLPNEYGYNYAQAIREINHAGWSYESIADWIGYESRTTISRILNNGAIPSHPEGEKLFILYFELFHRKPPMNVAQREHGMHV